MCIITAAIKAESHLPLVPHLTKIFLKINNLLAEKIKIADKKTKYLIDTGVYIFVFHLKSSKFKFLVFYCFRNLQQEPHEINTL